MKTRRFVALALILVAFGSLTVVRADHPAETEHPASANSIVAVATEAGDFTSFIAAVEAAGLVEKLEAKGPYTVFAPTDEAFAKLPSGMLDDLLEPANKAKLAGLLACHVVPGKIMAKDCKTMKATNVSGQDLDIEVDGSAVTVDGATVVKADMVADNGVIHAIDTVIIPAPPAKAPAAAKPKDHPAH